MSQAKKKMFKLDFKLSNSISGALLMILHAIALAALYITAKNLTHELHPTQVAFLYKFSLLIVVIPWCMKGGFIQNVKTKRIGLHIVRGTFSVFATMAFFAGLRGVEAVDASAITYLEQIIVLSVGILYFKEQFTTAKLVLIICGVVGALFVTKPGFEEFNMYYTFIFLALIFWAVNNFAIKMLGKTERTKPQLFYVMLIGSLFSFPLALEHWQPLEMIHVKYIAALSIFHLIHVIAFFKAFKFSDVSSVIPFDYCRLLFTGVLGFIFLNEVPDRYSLIGYILITIGGLYLIQEEARKKGFTLETERKALAIQAIQQKRKQRSKQKKKEAKAKAKLRKQEEV